MAITQNTYTGNGSTVLYSFAFPYLDTADVKVSINGTVTTAYTFANATTIQFNTAPANGAAIRIYRDTDIDELSSTFYAGSAIRAQNLNDNFLQNNYVVQEIKNSFLDINSGSLLGNLNMNGFKIIQLGTPTSSTDAATKGYIDATVAAGIVPDNNYGDIIVSGGATNWAVAPNAINDTKINDNAVTNSKIAGSAITDIKIDPGAAIKSTKLVCSADNYNLYTRNLQNKITEIAVSITDFGAVGDGVSDSTTAFQAAINAIGSAGGGIVYIPKGTYIVGGPQVSAGTNTSSSQRYALQPPVPAGINPPIVFVGEGLASIVKIKSSTYASLFNNTIATCNGWGFENFVIDGNRANQVSYNSGGASEGNNRDKLIKLKADDFFFRRMIVKDEAGRGVATILGNRSSCIDCRFDSIGANNSSNEPASDSSIWHPGNAGDAATGSTVTGNLVTNSGEYCTFVDAVGSDFIISGNAVSDCNKAVIISWSAGSAKNATIVGNVFTSRDDRAIHVYSNTTNKTYTFSNLLIDGNVLIGGSTIIIDGSIDTYTTNPQHGIQKAVISNNILRRGTLAGSTSKGIYVLKTKDLTVTGNYIYSSEENGIELRSVQTGVVNDNHIINPGENGIYINDGNVNVTVSDNKIESPGAKGTARHGIRVDWNATRINKSIDIVRNVITGLNGITSFSGTYAQAGTTTITITLTNHDFVIGDRIFLDFTSGTAADAAFVVTSVPTADTFTVETATAATTSGNVTIYEAKASGYSTGISLGGGGTFDRITIAFNLIRDAATAINVPTVPTNYVNQSNF